MKVNSPCWALSSHGHACAPEPTLLPAAAPARRPALGTPRRASRRAAQLTAYWMQAGTPPPELLR